LGLTEDAWDHAAKVWGFVIVRGADKNPLVTVGTLVGGLVLMGFGYVAAGMISRWVGARLLSRLGLNKTAAAPLQKIVYYVLLVTFAMLTLNILNVPITVFSFAGGAIAVGVGFGSQNIINNFISGLILLGERPIRVGDVIEIDGRTGRVTEIGARSTRIATGNNFEVIVPNSKFLESQVVNWTLTDDRISTSVRVGVSYGSPTREVERLLKLAANEHTDVAQDPAPSVAFEDFADDALVFSVSFWIDLQSASKGKVESDIRFRIDELFNEAGIVIAYPQRDVHLNMMRPLEVRLAPETSRELRRVAA
jgi:small-conductance mechanosensitive channel